jgi:hypothetical protein
MELKIATMAFIASHVLRVYMMPKLIEAYLDLKQYQVIEISQ